MDEKWCTGFYKIFKMFLVFKICFDAVVILFGMPASGQRFKRVLYPQIDNPA